MKREAKYFLIGLGTIVAFCVLLFSTARAEAAKGETARSSALAATPTTITINATIEYPVPGGAIPIYPEKFNIYNEDSLFCQLDIPSMTKNPGAPTGSQFYMGTCTGIPQVVLPTPVATKWTATAIMADGTMESAKSDVFYLFVKPKVKMVR